MTELVSIECLACGGTLDVPAHSDRVVCEYCNTKFFVRQRELTPVDTDTPIHPTAAEVAVGRIRSEIADLEDKLDVIGMPGSIAELVISTFRQFVVRIFFLGLCFYLTLIYEWPFEIQEFLEQPGLQMFRIILGIVGIGMIPGVFGVLKDGIGGITNSIRESRQRNQLKDELRTKLLEMGVLRDAFHASLARSSTRELASEKIIKNLKEEVAKLQSRLQSLGRLESVISIAISAVGRILLLLIISGVLIRLAEEDRLPIFGFLTPDDQLFYAYIRVGLIFLSVIFMLATLSVLENTAWKFDHRRYLANERDRLDARLQPELDELKNHRAAVMEHFDRDH